MIHKFEFSLDAEQAECFFDLFQDAKCSLLESKLRIECGGEKDKDRYLKQIDSYIEYLAELKEVVKKGHTAS